MKIDNDLNGETMYDVTIVGGGPGGYAAAIRGAQEGLKVLIVEKDQLGGTCLHRGCIPTKCFYYNSRLLREARASSVLSGGNFSVDPARLLSSKRQVVKNLSGGLAALMKGNGIEVATGTGYLTGPGQVTVRSEGEAAREVFSRYVILATGSRPAVPPFISIDGVLVQTTDQALDSEQIPGRVVIIGGGVIGIEMASIYLNLGCGVTLVEMLDDILITEDRDVRATIGRVLKKQGANLYLNAQVQEVARANGGVQVVLQPSEGPVQTLAADRVLVAVGRTPVLEGIDCAQLGIAMNGPYVKVDSNLETTLPGVFALGDLTGGLMLAHKASAEAEAVVSHIAGLRRPVHPRPIPRCIWGPAEIGAVGLREDQARASGKPVKVGKFLFSANGAAQALGDTEGFTKLVGDAQTGEILGVHIVGPHATDLIGQAVTVMTMEGAVEDLAEAVMAHPTLSETLMEAALDWNGMAIHGVRKT